MSRHIESRFLDNLERLGVAPDGHLLVAVSGGCDSIVLLHLLRFCGARRAPRLTVAHFDHAMRPGSAADARWLAGVCAAWGVPLVSARAEARLANEEAARRARYAFLHRAAREVGADSVATAHQADDQAETVLFRLLRGTGLAGVAGIAPRTASGVVRPLLPFRRRELERYARRQGLRWRTDPTNRSLAPARNWIRLRLLPWLERSGAPRVREELAALADLAREAEARWQERLAPLERALARREGEGVVLARNRMRDYDWETGSHILRNLLRQFGIVPSRTGTRTALQFITHAPSGREFQLPAGVRIRIEFDEARIERPAAAPTDHPLTIEDAGAGEGSLRLGGCAYRAEWRLATGEESEERAGWRAALRVADLRFPLRLRGWQPGDRLRTGAGTKTLKKLFVERRVARSLRSRLPLLEDATGAVLWVAGVGRAKETAPRPGEVSLLLSFLDD